jgi:uncharacterized membrane protein
VAVLPTPAGATRAEADGGDPSGHYLLGYESIGRSSWSVIWKDGAVLARLAAPSFYDINRHGVAVGAGAEHNVSHGYIYRDGRATPLPGGPAAAEAINDAGVIVGGTGGSGEPDSVPIRWSSPAAEPEKLALPPGMNVGRAFGIAEDGTVVGRPALFVGSKAVRLPEPVTGNRTYQMTFISLDGHVAAGFMMPSKAAPMTPLRWTCH